MGLAGGPAASPRPYPHEGNSRSQTCEAFKKACGASQAACFLLGSSSGNQPHKCWTWFPPQAKSQVFHVAFQEEEQVLLAGRAVSTSSGSCVHKRTLTPCAWPGGVAPKKRTWAAPHHARVLDPH